MEAIQATGKKSSREMGEDKMSVKIDMEMPKNCAACDLSYIDADTSELICSYNDCPASYTNRLKCCPLQEVKE